MTELDFDELDKAVNSLMTPSTTTAPTAVDSSAQELEVATEEAATVSAPVQTPVAGPVISLAKRRGRFMDVVHPSSDMKTSTLVVPSRQGITVAAPSSVTEPDQTVEPVKSEDEISKTDAAWPDPLDMQSTTTGTTPTETDDTQTEEESSFTDSGEPLSSPFLPGAKVEKRPLGGNQPETTELSDEMTRLNETDSAHEPSSDELKEIISPVPTDDVSEADEVNDTPDIAKSLELEEPAAPLPAELNSDLVAIEAGDATTLPIDEEPIKPAAHDRTSPSMEAAPKVEAPVTEAKEQSNPSSATPMLGSITQQYKEQPSTGDETHASIYDTDTDSEIAPLKHLTKKKTGWLYVVLIVLALLIGGGGGAAVYFFHLI